MIYPVDFESKVGFDRIRAQVSVLCSMNRAREFVADETFCCEPSVIEYRQSSAEEVRLLLSSEPDFPREEFPDTSGLAAKIRIDGTFLETGEVVVLRSALRTAGTLSSFILSRERESCPCLHDISEGVQPLAHIVREAERIIDDTGDMRDTASPELGRLRREIRSHESRVSRRLQQILASAKSSGVVDADAVISVRDGRAVIPVAAGNKRKLSGLVCDESATGRTVYIEPMEVVELNNELRELEYALRREEIRILTEFTDYIRPDAAAIAASDEYLARIDMLRAKARWALENGASRPQLSNEGRLMLCNARHPLLAAALAAQKRSVVPLDLTLDASNRILVISGPNAGGKSVCLKTSGLLQYMFQCGFPVTASPDSEFPVFENICIDIGDEQSMDNDLSTYSSHLNNMRCMLSMSGSAMVLVDEFGSGTEPVIGGAIAEAILERFVERGFYGIITTHYSNIKYYASETDGIINGAMTFDVRNIRPLFRLETGKPGSSFAIEIARKIGLSEDIINRASEKAGSDYIDLERQLRAISRDKRYWEQKRDRIRIADRKVDELEQNYRRQLENIRAERSEILSRAREEASELVAEANRRIENTIRTIRETAAERETTRVVRRELDEFRRKVDSDAGAGDDERITREMERLARRQSRRQERRSKGNDSAGEESVPQQQESPKPAVGSKVRIEGQDMAGEVVEIKGRRATVTFGAIKTTVDKDKLTVISGNEYRRMQRLEPTPVSVKISADITERKMNFRGSIDIRGMRVVEALEEVRTLVDDALMTGVGSVTILHGKGTGALKEEVRRYLKTVRGVKSATDAHPDMGGAGITIVEFE